MIHYWQGYMNAETREKQGPFIQVWPGKRLAIGNYKDGLAHGSDVVIEADGTKWIRTYANGIQDGQ